MGEDQASGMALVKPAASRSVPPAVLMAVLLLFLFQGCIAPYRVYEGAPLPKDAVAVVTTYGWPYCPMFRSCELWFEKVTGSYVSSSSWKRARTIEIPVGENTVEFVYKECLPSYMGCGWTLRTLKGRLTLTVEPGEKYRLLATYAAGRLWSWVINTQTHQWVAGETPPE